MMHGQKNIKLIVSNLQMFPMPLPKLQILSPISSNNYEIVLNGQQIP